MRHRKPHNHLRTKLLISRTFPSLNLETVEAVELSNSTVRQARQCDYMESLSELSNAVENCRNCRIGAAVEKLSNCRKTVENCRTLLSNCRTGAQDRPADGLWEEVVARHDGWMDGSDREQTPGSRQRAVPAPRRSPHTAQMSVSPQPQGN